MQKTFTLTVVDCPNCAERMAKAIRKVPGVTEANINFITRKLTLQLADTVTDETLASVQKVVARMQRGCVMV
ncbi:MAG: cation transporter [Eubacteriales bacterium]|nr:cation transporter [Eubacteriales bacterium]